MTPLSENKLSTKYVDKVTGEFEDMIEALVMMPLLDKKSFTKDVDKGTGDLEDMKEAVVTIRRKDLDKFEGQSKVSKGCFKLDIRF